MAKKAKAKKKAVKKAAPTKKKATVKKAAPAKKKPVAKKKAKAIIPKKVAKKVVAKKKAPAKKAKAKVITVKSLATAISEMNNIGDWEPPIKTGGTEEGMSDRIKAELSEVLDDDPFTPETWAVIKELGFGSSEKKKHAAIKKVGKAGKKKVSPKKMNMINTIVDILEKHGPITREAIYKKLIKDFPERNPVHLERRVLLQVPNSLNRERHLGIVGDKEKGFYIEK